MEKIIVESGKEGKREFAARREGRQDDGMTRQHELSPFAQRIKGAERSGDSIRAARGGGADPRERGLPC